MEDTGSQANHSESYITTLAICGIACTITYYTTRWAYRIARQKSLRAINSYLAKNIFSTKIAFFPKFYPNDYLDKGCIFNFSAENFNPVATYAFIKKHPIFLHILLKILLFFDYENTQRNFNGFITIMYKRHFEHNIKNTDKFDIKWQDMCNIIDSLFVAGINPRVRRSYEFSILREACSWHDIQMVKYLLTKINLDPDDRDQQGDYEPSGSLGGYPRIQHQTNPFYIACYKKQDAIIQLLIKHHTLVHPFLDTAQIVTKTISCFEQVIKKEHFHTIENPISIKLAKDFVAHTFLKHSSFNYQMWIEKFWLTNQTLQILPKEIRNHISSTPYKQHYSLDELLDGCFTNDPKIWPPLKRSPGGTGYWYSGDLTGLYRIDEIPCPSDKRDKFVQKIIEKKKNKAKEYFLEKGVNEMNLAELIKIHGNSIRA